MNNQSDTAALFDRLAAEYDGWYQTPLGALADGLEQRAVFALAGEVGHYLGLAVAILISTVNPQSIVIGGSLAALGTPFFDSLRHIVGEQTLGILANETEILPASLGADVNILGAVAQVLKGELGIV